MIFPFFLSDRLNILNHSLETNVYDRHLQVVITPLSETISRVFWHLATFPEANQRRWQLPYRPISLLSGTVCFTEVGVSEAN